MLNPLLDADVALQRRREQLGQAEQNRQLAMQRQLQLSLSRRAARPLGRVLLWLGAGLLRYGRVEAPVATRPYRPSIQSIELN